VHKQWDYSRFSGFECLSNLIWQTEDMDLKIKQIKMFGSNVLPNPWGNVRTTSVLHKLNTRKAVCQFGKSLLSVSLVVNQAGKVTTSVLFPITGPIGFRPHFLLPGHNNPGNPIRWQIWPANIASGPKCNHLHSTLEHIHTLDRRVQEATCGATRRLKQNIKNIKCSLSKHAQWHEWLSFYTLRNGYPKI